MGGMWCWLTAQLPNRIPIRHLRASSFTLTKLNNPSRAAKAVLLSRPTAHWSLFVRMIWLTDLEGEK